MKLFFIKTVGSFKLFFIFLVTSMWFELQNRLLFNFTKLQPVFYDETLHTPYGYYSDRYQTTRQISGQVKHLGQ